LDRHSLPEIDPNEEWDDATYERAIAIIEKIEKRRP